MALSLFSAVSLLPRLALTSNAPFRPTTHLSASVWRLAAPSITLPTISVNVPGLVSDIWEGILKAVPKKKTSHSKKRHRQLAGKALKDVNSLVQCSGCGKPKKAHFLCPCCVAEIQQSWREQSTGEAEMAKT